jgi:hypothetical protein
MTGSLAYKDNDVKILSYLARKTHSWSVLTIDPYGPMYQVPRFYKQISDLARIEEFEDSE